MSRTAAAIAAAAALNLPFGTLYSFSVFLQPMEALLGISRAEMSLVFALATVMLTLGMNVAPWFFSRLSPLALCAACGSCGAAGLALAASATSYLQFALGYGFLTGFGAGVGFIVVQQGVNQTVEKARGLANGLVVSTYPLGAMVGTPLLGWSIGALGVRATFAALGAVVLAGAAAAALLLHLARIRMHDAAAASAEAADPQRALMLRLATVFLLAASTWLLVMSQAAGIVQAYGGATTLALGATTAITGLIGAARIAGGWLTDRFAVPHVAMFAHAWSLAGALMLALWPGALVALPALAMIGMGYGFVSGLTAAAIARYWHRNAFGQVASRLYIAWCAAALTLPILAGWLYDRTQGYGAAILIAAAVNSLGMAVAARLPKTAIAR